MAQKKRTYKPKSCPPPPKRSSRMYVRLEPSKIAVFRFIMEGWDNIGLFTVINRHKGIMLLRYSPQQWFEMQRFIEAVQSEMELEVLTEYPEHAPKPVRKKRT